MGMAEVSSPLVLMVEDEPNLISLIRFYLERAGCSRPDPDEMRLPEDGFPR
jgi:CheY-like chemotaxis protein